jgi:hypothetical protein
MIFCGEKRGGRIGGVEGMMWFVLCKKATPLWEMYIGINRELV